MKHKGSAKKSKSTLFPREKPRRIKRFLLSGKILRNY